MDRPTDVLHADGAGVFHGSQHLAGASNADVPSGERHGHSSLCRGSFLRAIDWGCNRLTCAHALWFRDPSNGISELIVAAWRKHGLSAGEAIESTMIQLVTIASTLAVIQEARVAARKAGKASAARSERRSGAMLPIPLI